MQTEEGWWKRYSEKSHTTLPKHGGMGCDGWRARNERRKINSSRKIERPSWSYKSHNRKVGGKQGAGEIYHGRLNAGVAVRASRGIGGRVVVMEQSSEESENEERNNGKSLDWEMSAAAPFWMLVPHRVIRC